MSKIYKKYKNRPSTIEKIHDISKTGKDENHKRDCQEMVNFYIRNGFLPARLQKRALEIIQLSGKIITQKQKDDARVKVRYYLYAISDGESVKVGFSKNPDTRLKTMQTGHPKRLQVAWRTYCADHKKEAIFQEKKLHRFLGKYLIRGEWFSAKCIEKIESWEVKNRSVKREEEQIEADELILSGIPACF